MYIFPKDMAASYCPNSFVSADYSFSAAGFYGRKAMIGVYVRVVFFLYVLASIAIISHFHAHPDPVVSTIYEPMFILNNRRTNINTIAVSECLFESTLKGTVL